MTKPTPIPADQHQGLQQQTTAESPVLNALPPTTSVASASTNTASASACTVSAPTDATQPRSDIAHPQTGTAQSGQHEQPNSFAAPHSVESCPLPQQLSQSQSLPQPLPKAIVNVWIVRSVIGCTIGVLIVVAVVTAGIIAGLPGPPAWVIAIVAIVLWTLLVSICVFVAKYRYRFTSYRIDRNVFSVQTGFIFRSLTVVPYTRVQHVETEQGPILRHFGLVSVTVSTAADSHVIAGLEPELARKTLDQLAELVRLAKEDL